MDASTPLLLRLFVIAGKVYDRVGVHVVLDISVGYPHLRADRAAVNLGITVDVRGQVDPVHGPIASVRYGMPVPDLSSTDDDLVAAILARIARGAPDDSYQHVTE